MQAQTVMVPDGIATMAMRRRYRPDYIVRQSDDARFYIAKWRLPAHRVRSDCRMDNILTCRRRGAVSIAKTVGAVRQAGYAQPGDCTLIPSGEYAHYDVEGAGELLEMYIAPSLLLEYAERNELSLATVDISPALACRDSWLAGFCQMLESEIDVQREGAIASLDESPLVQLDVLWMQHAQHLLFAHVLRRYGVLPPRPAHDLIGLRSQRRYALAPQILRRVIEYIDANLQSEIHLEALARLAHVSERHFIRAFHAATGCTPYRYVIASRLRASAQLLRQYPEQSIPSIAAQLGFGSRSHFSVQFVRYFGVAPAQYRREVR